jgi:alkylated DNA repair dioxygenase AlkB
VRATFSPPMIERGFARLALPDADLLWSPAFLSREEADAMLAVLDAAIPWQRHHLRIFGRDVPAPRLSAWIGDPGAAYTYSRVRFEPLPWPEPLAALRRRVAEASAAAYNSVLANRYADGTQSMGWHADDEPELGPRPVIASVSLGAARRFALRHRHTRERRDIELTHGSMLLMRGETQAHWQHALPRTTRPLGTRINLTFRNILV